MKPVAVLLPLLVALGSACSSVRTQVDYDPGADFSAWRTYAWYPSGPATTGDLRLDSPLLHRRIVDAVDRNLEAFDFARLEQGEPDFYVNFHLSTERHLDVWTMNRVYAPGPRGAGWGRSGWGGAGWSETVVDEYEEGTLVIDLVDVASRQLVWRGAGTRLLTRAMRQEQLTRQVNETVDEILAAFPPNGR